MNYIGITTGKAYASKFFDKREGVVLFGCVFGCVEFCLSRESGWLVGVVEVEGE